MLTSHTNPVLVEVRAPIDSQAISSENADMKVYFKLNLAVKRGLLKAHNDPDDWYGFTPEVVEWLNHAVKVLERIVNVYFPD